MKPSVDRECNVNHKAKNPAINVTTKPTEMTGNPTTNEAEKAGEVPKENKMQVSL